MLMRQGNAYGAKEEIDRAYDFLIGGKYFEPTGKIPVTKLSKLIEALKAIGDLPAGFAVDFVMPASSIVFALTKVACPRQMLPAASFSA